MNKTKAEIKALIDEAYAETNVVYKFGGNFFTPQLQDVNHLQVGRSKIISNPLTILLEYLLEFYHSVQNWTSGYWQRVFPRKDVIYGKVQDDALVGRIVYKNKAKRKHGYYVADDVIPIRTMRVEFWARSRFFEWRKLSEGHTDQNGYFSLPFDLRAAKSWTNRTKTQFEIYQTVHRICGHDEIKDEFHHIETIHLKKSEFIGLGYNLRTIKLPHWEYDLESPLPRVKFAEGGVAPESYARGRVRAMSHQVVPIELTKQKHLLQIKRDPSSISIESMQADYPKNLTIAVEERLPGFTRSDEWFGMRMMNGMNMATFIPDKENLELLWAKYFGSCHYQVNNTYAFPTSEIKFKMNEDGIPIPIEIHLTGPLNAFNSDPYQKHVFRPNDGDKWLQAKRVTRVTAALCAELDQHLTGTHLNTEQFSIAVRRNMRMNPIAALLFPHTKAVVLINQSADDLLINGYIPQATALTPKSCIERATDVLGFQDWKGWKTMDVLSEAHTYAKLENLFYSVVSEFVDHFINVNLEQIKERWLAVYRFSEDLVTHSVPLYPLSIKLDEMTPEARALEERRIEYLIAQYRLDLNQERRIIHNVVKAVSPITSSEYFDENKPEELQNLRDICKYIIIQATFIHTWVNKHQYEDIGEVLYSCLGLRFGEKENGVMAPENDYGISPDLTRSTQMMWFSNLLSRTGYGFITNNEENDIDPHFVELLLEKKEEFISLGLDITQIASRTNI